MIDNIYTEFTKFFTYSSIQAKIISTLVATIILVIVRKVVTRFLINRIKDVKLRYQWQKGFSYAFFQ